MLWTKGMASIAETVSQLAWRSASRTGSKAVVLASKVSRKVTLQEL